jgi:hypothetical protein
MSIRDMGAPPPATLSYIEIEKLKDYILCYRGRVRANRKDSPNVLVIGRVTDSYYIEASDCVVLVVDVYNYEPQRVFYYMGDLRNYYVHGVEDFSKQTAMSEDGEYDPLSVRFLD